MSSDSLDRRVQQLEDRGEIKDLGVRYFLDTDDFDAQAVGELFTTDGSVRNWEGRLDVRGRTDLRTHYTKKDGGRDRYSSEFPSVHCARGHLITALEENTATGIVTAFTERGQPAGSGVAAYRYYDSYRREEGRWRFRDRLVLFWYKMHLSDLVDKWSDGRQSKRIPEDEPPTSGGLPFAIDTWVRSQWQRKMKTTASERSQGRDSK